MKLKNRKTGKITEIEEVNLVVMDDERDCYESFAEYHSLAELNADWEDYTPKEPLIKDEKIRKAVRAWAEANEREYLLVIKSGGRLEISDGSPHLIYISFHVDNDTLKILDDRTYYPIDKLCGEEEI